MVPALTPALTKITRRLIGPFACRHFDQHNPPNLFDSRSSKSEQSQQRLELEEHSQSHLLHGIMTKHSMFERRESSGSGSSLVAAEGAASQKRPFMIGVAGGTASGKVSDF